MIHLSDEPTFKDYLRSCRRHAWIVATTSALALTVGAQQAFLTTPRYRASALVLADASTSNTKDFVDKVVVPELARFLELLSAQVFTAERLGRLADELALFPDASEPGGAAREALSTEIVGFDTFRVSFVHPDPARAAAAANRLAESLLAEHRRQRDAHGEETNRLLAAELQAAGTALDRQDREIERFRTENMGALPGQTEGTLRAIERWQGDLRVNTLALERASERVRLAEASTPPLFRGPEFEALLAEIRGLRAERSKIDGLIGRSESLLARAGEVEGRLQEMQREYGAGMIAYNDLLRRKQEAALRVGLDRARFDSLFRVVDPATPPVRPFRPARGPILAVAIAVGLALGIALAIVRDHFDESFREPEELKARFGVPVLAAIPRAKETTP